MAKRDVIVNIGFNADTSQIKNALNELDKSLKNIQKLPGRSSSLFDDREIREASQAALELEKHLRAAMDVKTGNLDLSRFSASLKVSNKSLQDYYNKLISVGPDGQQAFYQLAQAISTAETPTLRVNKALDEMIGSLKRTVQWQISSSVIHGFMGAVQKAYGYAQDLNESLNNIRIVTGQNTDQMAAFAEKANKAARALSTTTTEYTNAALIYYQQGGMSDAEIAERTDVTIKMANASRTSAETVSDQMTSIWNNFYDGSKSLEYYADVLTALGAATASSSDEIVQGVQKFAAVGDTVGLSYEYAASALATVTATTRESADVVGTAFKTLFARIQGLQLGETLDDGTSLNKYSQALDSVGISIFETNGEIKAMDKILDELGNKWNNLAKDQQTALAQTVAGVRQYTQLIALMDNWDFFQQNLAISYGAEGTLDEQAQIYAESWEAARNRVKAAAEDIYDSLINDDFFINILNGIEKALNALSGFVDGIGGLEGILSAVGGIFLNIYAKRMPETLDNLKQNFLVFSGLAQRETLKIQKTTEEYISKQENNNQLSNSEKIQNISAKALLSMREQLIVNSKNMTQQEQREYEARIKNVEAMYSEAKATAKLVDDLKAEVKAKQESLKYSSSSKGGAVYDYDKANAELKRLKSLKNSIKIEDEPERFEAVNKLIVENEMKAIEAEERIQAMIDTVNKHMTLDKEFDLSKISLDSKGNVGGEEFERLKREVNKVIQSMVGDFDKLAEQYNMIETLDIDLDGQIAAWKKYETVGTKSLKELKQSILDYSKIVVQSTKEQPELFDEKQINKIANELQQDLDKVEKEMLEGKAGYKDYIKTFEDFKKKLNLSEEAYKLAQDIQKVEQELESLDLEPEQLEAVKVKMERLAKAGLNLRTQMENNKRAAQEGPEHFIRFSEVMTNFGSAVMTTHAMIESFNYSMKVLGDESSSSLEKFGASLSLFSTIGATLSTLSKTGNSILSFMNQAGRLTPGIVTSLNAVTKGTATLGQAVMALGAKLIAAAIPVAIVMAAIWALSEAYQYWKSQQPEEQLKAAKEEAALLSEELEKAKNASEELRNSIESYDNAVDKIKSLTEGTTEWRDAIEEANEQARILIDNNEELKGKYSFNAKTGLIEFDKEILDNLDSYANNQNKILERQKLYADNNVLKKENDVKINEITEKAAAKSRYEFINNFDKSWSKTFGTSEGTLQWLLNDAIDKVSAESAITKLLQEYEKSQGNYNYALNSLSQQEKEVINKLEMAEHEIQELCQAILNNTKAIKENNKQAVDNIYSDNSIYNNNENKDLIATFLEKELSKTIEILYEFTYKFGAGISNEEVQKQYAELMDWDPNLIENKSTYAAIYYDKEGNEHTISNDNARQAIAYAKAEEQMSDYDLLLAIENSEKLIEAEQENAKKVVNYDDYLEYVKNIIALGNSLNLNTEESLNFLKQYNSLGKKYTSFKLQDALTKSIQATSSTIQGVINNLENQLSEEQLELLVDVALDSNSMEDFLNKTEEALLKFNLEVLNSTKSLTQEILNSAQENQIIDYTLLQNNEEFNKWLKNQKEFSSIVELQSKSFIEQFSIVLKFYQDIQSLRLKDQEELKKEQQKDLAYWKTLLSYKQGIEKKPNVSVQFKNDAELFSEIEIEKKIKEIQKEIDSIDADIEINLQTNYSEEILYLVNNLQELKQVLSDNFNSKTSMFEFDYEELNKWIQLFPDLFSTISKETGKVISMATVGQNGLISLNKEYVESYLSGQQEIIDGNIDIRISDIKAKKIQKESEKERLLEEKKMFNQSLEDRAKGEELTADQIALIKGTLTDFIIDSDYDQEEGLKKVLYLMTEDWETYWDIIVNETVDGVDRISEQYERLVQNTKLDMLKIEVGKFDEGKTFNISKQDRTLYNNIVSHLKDKIADDLSLSRDEIKQLWDAYQIQETKSLSIDTESLSNPYKYIQNFIDYLAAQSSLNISIDEYNASQALEKELNEKTGDRYKSTASFSMTPEEIENFKNEMNRLFDEAVARIDSELVSMNNQILSYEVLKTANNFNFDNLEEYKEIIKYLKEIAERYHEITREIQYYENELDKIEKRKQRLTGKEYYKILEEESKILESQIARQNELNQLQEAMLLTDKTSLIERFGADNISFDEQTGEIVGYEQLVTNRGNLYESEMKRLDEEIANVSDSKSSRIKELEYQKEQVQEQYEKDLEAIETYEETLDKVKQGEGDLLDLQNQLFDTNYEKLTFELELDLKIRDSEMKKIEYALNQLSDDSFANIEAFSLWEKKFKHANDTLWDYNANYQTLLENQDKYTDTQFIEHIETVRDGIYEQLNALTEYDKQMKEFYGDTLQKAQEEIGKYTDQMESVTDTLEHYKNLVELINGEYDFENIGTIIDGQIETTYNDLDQAQKDFELIKKQYNDAQIAIANAQSEEEKLTLEKAFESLAPAYDQAWKEVLSKTEEYVQLLKDKLEHKMNEAAHAMEMAFTDGLGFDFLNDSMDRAESYADEFLTKTNQIYETQKLMRAAQVASDKTDNAAAKARLANFAQDTQRLQEKNQLSNYELEIQQAKYDLLLAQIALEEAQDAKSTVRLQRTSEGTFGYVYTADEEKIADAEQKVADEQNDLYNILKDGEEDYAKKIYETEQNLTEALIDLTEKRANGQFESEEEYQNAVLQTKEEFGRMLEFYEEMRNLSFSEDYLWRKDLADNITNSIYKAESDLVQNTIVQTGLYTESWTTSYDTILAKSKNWSEYSTEYINTCETAFKEWQINVSNDNIIVQEKLSDTSTAVKDLTDKSAELAKKLDTEVRDKAEQTLTQVANLTTAYAAQVLEVDALKESYHKLIEEMNEYLKLNNTIVPPEDYSLAMANYIRNGGNVGDINWNKYEQERTSKMNEAQYTQYQSTSGLFNELMLQYNTYKDLGQKNALTDYVDNIIDTKGIWDFELIKQLIQTAFSNSVQLNTGGYTGVWGTSGKLAVLHEKELVLNESDTSNFLIASGILRDIAKLIDINSIANRLTGISDIWNNNLNTSNNLEQSVQIEAHFPNATDKNEIEEAFNNLINTATQYAYRN